MKHVGIFNKDTGRIERRGRHVFVYDEAPYQIKAARARCATMNSVAKRDKFELLPCNHEGKKA